VAAAAVCDDASVRMLSLVHGGNARAGVFEDVVRENGHDLEEWSLAWGTPPPRPLDDYDALLVFGGSMHADQDDRHPWLREETMFLQRVLDVHQPVLGVCLGAQLLARAAHAPVLATREPEIGWYEVELTPEGREDPVLGRLPERFTAFQWHYYTYRLPAGAVELARSSTCNQAFRLGESAWGVQFHPEVTEEQISSWLADEEDPAPDGNSIGAETAVQIERWNELGRLLCAAFVDAVAGVPASS
jgi:GMP synthase (glutamine-hydrolysing)